MNAEILRRPIHPEVRVLDAAKGIAEYIASDETLDAYREVIRADGWRFSHFQKNAPFVDSHDYSSVDKLLGKVVAFGVEKKKLVEQVQWAIDVPQNQLAQIGWAMTQAGYLKAVSVGFAPTRMVSRWDGDRAPWAGQLQDLGLREEEVRTIFIEQEQLELSACIIGANPNAIARSYKVGAIDDAAIDLISVERAKRESAGATDGPDDVARACHQAQAVFLRKFEKAVKKI